MVSPFFQKHRLNRLAREMQRGDRRAAAALYEELSSKVFGFCVSRVRDRETAEDLSQEIFLKLVNGIETFDLAKGNFTVWFWRLARNTVVDYYRRPKEMNFSQVGDESVVEALAIHNPVPDFENNFEKARLTAFLSSLANDEQELFEMRYLADLSYQEMSRILEKSEGALRVAVNRLKKKINRHFAA